MNFKLFLLLFSLSFLTFMSCSDEESSLNSDVAEEYLNEVLDIMESNSVNRYKIDWIDFRAEVLDKLVGTEYIRDAYPAIEEALVLLGDNHSSYTRSSGGTIYASTLTCEYEYLYTPSLTENIGYVKINSFSGSSSGTAAISYANEIQDQIELQDGPDVIGWIIDLRNNLGGNMWPMVAGCGPILGEGVAGYFIDPDGIQESWGFFNGASVNNGNIITQLNESYELILPNPKVAVLYNNAVASSGEALAISFIGRENTKSFGNPTCGLSTSNMSFILSDRASLSLTTGVLADRNKKQFGNQVDPDSIVFSNEIIKSAVEWIEN